MNFISCKLKGLRKRRIQLFYKPKKLEQHKFSDAKSNDEVILVNTIEVFRLSSHTTKSHLFFSSSCWNHTLFPFWGLVTDINGLTPERIEEWECVVAECNPYTEGHWDYSEFSECSSKCDSSDMPPTIGVRTRNT